MLSTGKGYALLRAALAKAGKEVVKTLKRPANRRRDLRKLQVFFDRQAWNDAAIFGNQTQASNRSFIAFHVVKRLVIEPDFTMRHLRIAEACNRAQRRSFTRTVTTQKCKDFTLVDVKADALNDVAFAIVRVHVPDGKESRRSAGSIGPFGEFGFCIHS